MTTHDWLLRLIRAALALCLVLLVITMCYGHSGASLVLADSYVSDYLIAAPHWPWLVIACFSFALVLMLLAVGFLLKQKASALVIVGSALLAAAAMGMFFVAYAPVRHAHQPPAAPHAFWTPSWWFSSQTAATPYEKGMADAYSDMHYHASRLALSTGVLALLLIAVGSGSQEKGRRFALITITLGLVMGGMFLMANHPTGTHGLWQRAGFAVLYAWLWIARHHLTESPHDRSDAVC
jgi:hypothetical protein